MIDILQPGMLILFICIDKTVIERQEPKSRQSLSATVNIPVPYLDCRFYYYSMEISLADNQDLYQKVQMVYLKR